MRAAFADKDLSAVLKFIEHVRAFDRLVKYSFEPCHKYRKRCKRNISRNYFRDFAEGLAVSNDHSDFSDLGKSDIEFCILYDDRNSALAQKVADDHLLRKDKPVLGS